MSPSGAGEPEGDSSLLVQYLYQRILGQKTSSKKKSSGAARNNTGSSLLVFSL